MIVGWLHKSFSVDDSTHAGAVRRAMHDVAMNIGLSNDAKARAEIVINELTSNFLKHTGSRSGEILLAALPRIVEEGKSKPQGIEIIALDKGPGMRDVERMLADGTSTSGTLGGGLGAIKRLSDEFYIDSVPEKGTVVVSRFWNAGNEPTDQREGLDLAAITVAKPGETKCGDSWAFCLHDRKASVVVIDGLGHGHKAAVAAGKGLRTFMSLHDRSAEQILQRMHEDLHDTQGAVVAVAELNQEKTALSFCSVGNVAGRVVSKEQNRTCASTPGVIGYQFHKAQTFSYPWSDGSILIMNSDGLGSFIGSAVQADCQHPVLIAATLYRDYNRGTDDSTVVVTRQRGGH